MLATTCCGSSRADDKQARTQEGKDSERGRVSGVIVKIEPVAKGETKGRDAHGAWKLTINPDVVWRDFVRDQAIEPEKAAAERTEKAAASGNKAVATKGQPRDDQTFAVVVLDGRTEITTRYRTSTDAVSDGSPTPEGAARVENASDKASTARAETRREKSESRREVMKARKLEPKELKPGLWVEVRFQHREGRREPSAEGQDRARRIMVMRPVGGPDTPPDKEKPAR
jgi:hypothetical protein